MWSECIVDFIVYYLILDHGWDSEVYGTITAIQKFVPVVMNPFWVAMSEVPSCGFVDLVSRRNTFICIFLSQEVYKALKEIGGFNASNIFLPPPLWHHLPFK